MTAGKPLVQRFALTKIKLGKSPVCLKNSIGHGGVKHRSSQRKEWLWSPANFKGPDKEVDVE